LAFPALSTLRTVKDFPVTWIISTGLNQPREKESLKKLEEGKIDIIIGTHAILARCEV